MPDAAPPVRLSVVIPTHNRRDLLLRAVASVLAQEAAAGIEIIVVDDASTDDSAGALKQAYADDPRVRVLTSPRRHASGARNLGFAAARGELVCFLDSDDCWLPEMLGAVLDVFARFPALAFVSVDGATFPSAQQPALQHIVAGDSPGWSHPRFTDVALHDEELVLGDGTRARLRRGDFFPAIVFGDLFYLSGLVMRRECAVQAGPFNERFRYYNDWEFFARLCRCGDGAYLDYDGFRRDTGRHDQISRRRPPIALARRHLYLLRSQLRHGDRRYDETLRAALDHAQYRMAVCLLSTGRHGAARRYLARCIRRGYRPLRCLLRYAVH
jgi:glycosyltransferase involved in cell wall biosynthesis